MNKEVPDKVTLIRIMASQLAKRVGLIKLPDGRHNLEKGPQRNITLFIFQDLRQESEKRRAGAAKPGSICS